MKFILTCLICLSTLICSAQLMKLERLQSYIGMPVTAAADSLHKQNWTLHPELSATQGISLYRTYAYGEMKNNKARAWFRLHADHALINQVYYQCQGEAEYLDLQRQIVNTTAVKKNIQEIDQGRINTLYVLDAFIFQTTTSTDDYSIMVMANTN